MVDQRMVSLFLVLFTTYIYNYIHIYSLATILKFLKSEADIVEVTVMEVYREPTPCIIFNIVYNLLNNGCCNN